MSGPARLAASKPAQAPRPSVKQGKPRLLFVAGALRAHAENFRRTLLQTKGLAAPARRAEHMEGAGPGRAGGVELMAGLRGGARGAQPARDVEDAGETLLSFYDLDTDRDLEAGDVGAGHQAPRVRTRPGCSTLVPVRRRRRHAFCASSGR